MTMPHEPLTSTRLPCELCGKTMLLSRVSPVSAHESYEFWTCVGCGHHHVRAVHMKLRQDDPTDTQGCSPASAPPTTMSGDPKEKAAS